jgi:hypothetical protein
MSELNQNVYKSCADTTPPLHLLLEAVRAVTIQMAASTPPSPPRTTPMIIYIADGTRASLHIYLPSSESLESSLEEKEESCMSGNDSDGGFDSSFSSKDDSNDSDDGR